MGDHERALDALSSCPEEEPSRIGCEEMAGLEAIQINQAYHPPDRRDLLRGIGLLGVSAVASRALAPAVAHAAPPRQEAPLPAMRTPHRSNRSLDAGEKPARPSLAVLVLNRMAFGPRPGDISAFNKLGASDMARIEAYVEQQLNPEGIDDSSCEAVLASYGFETLAKPLQQLWTDHLQQKDVDWKYRQLPGRETERATFLRALFSKRQLTEVLADFWHTHFNVYAWDSWPQSTWVHYDRDVIRANMFGNFRKMVGDVAKSPAMLHYLDNQYNEGGNPNENWARELFELHAFGAENYYGVRKTDDPAIFDENGDRRGYIDSDVYGATTCFTGWRTDTETGLFKYDASKHFPYQKIVLGETIPEFMGQQDGEIVLDMLVNHRGTATHIARKLCRRLISDTPPESIVQAAAEVFHTNINADDQLLKVVRTILLSEEFRTTWGEKIKRPFEFACSLLRATGCNFDARSDSFFWWYNAMGQPLFGWRPPDGYPDVKEAWSTTMPMLQRWRFTNSVLDWTIGGEGADKDNKRIKVDGIMPADRTNPGEIADFWSNRLLGYKLPDNERQQVMELIAYGRGLDSDIPADQIAERLRYMVALILMSPSFQWR